MLGVKDKGFIAQRRDDAAELIYLNARYLDPKLGFFTQPDWFDVRLAGVGVNRYAYSGNDPINLSDPQGSAYAGSSFDSDPDLGKRAVADAHSDRDALYASADKADSAAERLELGKGFGLFSGFLEFNIRFSLYVGKPNRENLRNYSKNARIAAAAIGKGTSDDRGVRLEHYGLFEDKIRAENPGITSQILDEKFANEFGYRAFADPNGGPTSFSGRVGNAGGWAERGDPSRVSLDYGYEPGRGIITHEITHGDLNTRDLFNLRNRGYGKQERVLRRVPDKGY